MAYHPLLKVCVATAIAASATYAVATPLKEVDRWVDVTQGAHPATYPSVPLPSGVYGSGACVLLVVALRLSRHRRWVTLR